MQIDLTLCRGEQPLAKYSAEKVSGGHAEQNAQLNGESKERVPSGVNSAPVTPAGGGEWYSTHCHAAVVLSDALDTCGVQITRDGLAEFATAKLDGTYDGLPLAEKHRLSGHGGTLASWLASFHRARMARPR